MQKITNEDVEAVYESSNNINRKQALFNNNIKGLRVYTFQFKGGKKVQLALNEELENIVKIVYRGKRQHLWGKPVLRMSDISSKMV